VAFPNGWTSILEIIIFTIRLKLCMFVFIQKKQPVMLPELLPTASRAWCCLLKGPATGGEQQHNGRPIFVQESSNDENQMFAKVQTSSVEYGEFF